MDYSIFIYIGLTVMVVALAAFVDLQAGRQNIQLQNETCDMFLKKRYVGITRIRMWNLILVIAVFLLLFAVSACRIAVGNDYWVYRSDFLLIQQQRHTSFEIGFIMVVKLLQSMLNYDQYLPIFAFFAFFTILFYVRGMYDQSDWFGYTVFLLMTTGYYFSSLDSVRYYLVLAIAVYSIKYVLTKDWIRFVLWILAAACFHKSVLIVIPFYFLASRKWKKRHMLILAAVCASMVLIPGIYRRIIFFFYPFYEGSMFDTGDTSLTNIARCMGVLILALLYYKDAIKEEAKNQFYFYCNLGALLLYVFGSFIPEISRIGYYLNVTNIFLIPAILQKIPDKKQRKFWCIVTTIAFMMYFALFLRSAYNTDIRLLPYRNWIFQ